MSSPILEMGVDGVMRVVIVTQDKRPWEFDVTIRHDYVSPPATLPKNFFTLGRGISDT
jgi:hypothetical protein